jgi:hypothetical protein
MSAPTAKLAWEIPLRLIRSRAYREPGQLGGDVGFFSRLLVPRSVRRAAHPGRAVKRAITPKPIKKARRALHPVDNAVYSMQRSVATSIRSERKGKNKGVAPWKLSGESSES